MDEKKRPGGLTALAVINFIFAAFALISISGTMITRVMIPHMPMDQMTAEQVAALEALQNMNVSLLVFMACKAIVIFLLLLLSGIGYLKLKRVLGRAIGNIYGVLAILIIFVTAVMFPKELGGGFGIMKILGLIYPVLTLILLNTVFRKNLVE